MATEFAPTIAEGTAIKSPIRLQEILACLHRSGGNTVAVEEDEIGAAILKLAAMGLYAEPTSCGVVAALDRLLETGDIKPGETMVVLLTGTGLKATALSYCQKLCMGLSCGGAILAFSIHEFDASNDLGELI